MSAVQLDVDVGKCDIEVVTSDADAGTAQGGGNFFPPSMSTLATVPAAQVALSPKPRSTLAQRVAAVPGLSNAELRGADAVTMAATLQGLWAAMKNQLVEELAAGELHQDGTPRISSQVSVWLIGRISQAYGRRKLVQLSRVKDVEALRSLGGLTKLLMSVIDADTEGTSA